MKLSKLKTLFINKLAKTYPNEEILSFYYILVKERLQLDKIDIFLEPNLEVSKNDIMYFDTAVESLKQEKPIQYIIGKSEFFGLLFKVSENVLIPRPETEELIEWIISDTRQDILEVIQNKKKIEKKRPTTILDIGTGSGCIAIALAKNLPNSKVTAIDISKCALEIAKKNAISNEVKVNLIRQDILNFSTISTNMNCDKYDIIVSNPPYVRELEKQEIQNNVLKNEPHLALFVTNDNPLLFYDKIADFAKVNLAENGLVYLEINQYLAAETIRLLELKGFKLIELREDLFGNKRMIKATK